MQRVLRLLDALAKTLAARRWEVLAAKRFEWSTSPEFLVRAPGCMFALEVEETLVAALRTLSERPRDVGLRRGGRGIHLVASGDLRLKLMFSPHKYRGRTAWWDDVPRRLDEQLGRVVVAVERAAHIGRIEHEERVRLEEESEAAERKRLRPERLRRYTEWLGADLDEMVNDWDRARRLRDFLAEYDRRLGEHGRDEVTAAWMRMARGLAESADPMSRVTEIAKELEPSDDVLAGFAEEARSAAERAVR
jgi:hypothetical protein